MANCNNVALSAYFVVV